MAYASADMPTLPPLVVQIDLRRVAEAVRSAARAVAFVTGRLAVASVLWVMLAGPGLTQDRASTVPVVSLRG